MNDTDAELLARAEAAESQLAEANQSLERVRRLAAEDSMAEQSKRLAAERELAETSKQCEQYRLETHRWADAVKKDRIERDRQSATISAQAEEIERLRGIISNLVCPTCRGSHPCGCIPVCEFTVNLETGELAEAALTQPQPEGQSHE